MRCFRLLTANRGRYACAFVWRVVLCVNVCVCRLVGKAAALAEAQRRFSKAVCIHVLVCVLHARVAGDYFYQLIEAPDVGLICDTAEVHSLFLLCVHTRAHAGQSVVGTRAASRNRSSSNWPLGTVQRKPDTGAHQTRGLLHSGVCLLWFVCPLTRVLVYVQYPKLFTDSAGKIYLEFWTMFDGQMQASPFCCFSRVLIWFVLSFACRYGSLYLVQAHCQWLLAQRPTQTHRG